MLIASLLTLNGIADSLVAAGVWAALGFAVYRVRKKFEKERNAADAYLQNFKVVSGLASAMPHPALASYLQARIHQLARFERVQMFIFLAQLIVSLAAIPPAGATLPHWLSFAVCCTSIGYTGFSALRSIQSLDTLEAAFMEGFGAGILLDLNAKRAAIANPNPQSGLPKPSGGETNDEQSAPPTA